MSKEILILGKEAFDKLKPDVQRFIKHIGTKSQKHKKNT